MNTLEAFNYVFNNPGIPLYYNDHSYYTLKLEFTHIDGWICYYKIDKEDEWYKCNSTPMIYGWVPTNNFLVIKEGGETK